MFIARDERHIFIFYQKVKNRHKKVSLQFVTKFVITKFVIVAAEGPRGALAPQNFSELKF